MSGILAHRQSTSTYCPGEFDFTRYLRLVRFYFNQSAAPKKYRMTVDNTNKKRFATAGAWQTSSFHSAQAFGPNYKVATPANVLHRAYFKIRTPRAGRYHVYTWYPADRGYNNLTVYWIRTSGGWVRRVINQRINGKRWVHLGTFQMRAGDGWYIFIPRRSNGTGLIIADAVSVVEA